MRLLLPVLLALTLAAPVSAAKGTGSCSVTPNPVPVNAPLTITASADVLFMFELVGPDGISRSWPSGPAGTVTYEWAAPLAGDWTVTVYMVKRNGTQPIGSCSFEVTP